MHNNIFKLEEYAEYFYDVRAYHVLDGKILSHIPIYPDGLGRFGVNIHGHLHDRRVTLADGEIDNRYFSVCVEQIDFTPIELSTVIELIKQQQ